MTSKVKKVAINENGNPAEPKKRAPRKKKQVTKEERLQLLTESLNQIKQFIEDLKAEEQKISCLNLKSIPELVKETLEDLDEDMKEISDEIEKVKTSLDDTSQ